MSTFLFEPTTPLSWTQVLLEGADAKDFLDRLTTVSIKRLSIGEGKNGLFLNSSGKIEAFFKLWCHSPTEFVFEFDAGRDNFWKEKLLKTIDHYTFAEKMTLNKDDSGSLSCYWIFPDEQGLKEFQRIQNLSTEPKPDFLYETKGPLHFYFQRIETFGRTWITAWGPREILKKEIKSIFKNHIAEPSQGLSWKILNEWRIHSITPWVDAEIREGFNPLEIGISHAVAHNKGCYPGQEVMERIRSMGAPPKRLVQLSGKINLNATPLPPETKIYSQSTPPIELGIVTSSIVQSDLFLALGVIRKTHAVPGTPLTAGDKHQEFVIKNLTPIDDEEADSK